MKQLLDWHSVLKEHFFRCYSFWCERENKPWREAWIIAQYEVLSVKRNPFVPKGELIPPHEIAQFIMWINQKENIRRCSVCGRPMTQGYYLDGSYVCSDDCRNEWYMEHGNTKGDKEAAIQEYYQDNEQADSEYYWTDWEEQHFYFD